MKNQKSHRIFRNLAVILLVSIMMFGSMACAETTDCVSIGLETVGILSEMTQSRDYLNLFLNSERALEILDSMFNTGDYTTPVAVYRLQPSDPREWSRTRLPEAQLEMLDSLSPVLQEQVYAKMQGVTLMSSQINASRGSEVLAVTSVLQALLKNTDLAFEEPEYYLFVFENGLPVLVTYGWHQAAAGFLALENSATESVEALQATLEFYGVEVTPVVIQ